MADMNISAAAAGKVMNGAGLAENKRVTGKNDQDAFKQMMAIEAKKAAEDGSDQVKAAGPITSKPVLKFSNHALERMNSRGITFSPEQITNIETAAAKAGQKGAKEALVLQDDKALIVS